MSRYFPILMANAGSQHEGRTRSLVPWFLLAAVLLTLFAAEVLLLSILEYRFPSNIHSPAADFWSFARVAWSQAPWATTQEWLDRPLLEVLARDQSTGQTAWTLNYYLPGMITHLVVAVITVVYWYQQSIQKIRPLEWASLAGAGLALLASTFYLSIAAHCAGSTWLGIVMIRSIEGSAIQLSFMMQRLALDMPSVILFIQLAIGAAGLVVYYRLIRSVPLSST